MSAIFGLNTTGSEYSASYPWHLSSERRITIHPDCRSRLVYLTDPEGLAVESYRLLRRRLNTLHPKGGVILMTSPSSGEGKTLTSINLAWSLAEARFPTCLVDLDFRAPGVSRTLGYAFPDGGVQEVIEGNAEVHDVVHSLGEHRLSVLGIRNRRSSPGYLFCSPAMPTMVAELRGRFKWVILDFAPVIPMADVSEMIPYVDGAILVVRTGKTAKDMLTPSIEAIGPKLWGVVANDCAINGSTYYGYYGKSR